jgi:hypothetical protein
MANRITDFVAHYRMPLIAGAALIVLAAYFLPIADIISGSAEAAKGDNNSDKNQNPKRFEVCDHNPQPQKCYGHSVDSD